MAANEITVKLDRVSKSFGDFTAVKDLSLSVRAGRVFGLLGPNGAGKTTTIRMIVNITAPDSGSILLFGRKIDAQLQDRIGYLPEERGLYRRMQIADQLRFFAELKNVRGKIIESKIDEWLARVKLSEWKNKRSMELSKGMQQKIQFITSVIHDPDLLILDEPFLRSRSDQRRVVERDRARSETRRKDDHLLDAPDGSRRKDLRRHLSAKPCAKSCSKAACARSRVVSDEIPWRCVAKAAMACLTTRRS